MDKNILVLTSIFPSKDLPSTYTKIVFYFVECWKKMGYNVYVVHNVAIYHRIFYFISSLFRDLIASLTGTTIPLKRYDSIFEYEISGISVIRIPIYKAIPHLRFTSKRINGSAKLIIDYLKKKDFVPQIVIGHWCNPQIELLYKLKSYYCNVETCLVLHEHIDVVKKLFGKDFDRLINSVTYLGFRSLSLLNECHERYQLTPKMFLCQSGIPDLMLRNENTMRNFGNGVSSFCFVGMLIKRKYPEILVKVIPDLYSDSQFSIAYVGTGQLEGKIRRMVRQRHIESNVCFMGRVDRNKVHEQLRNMDCLVMISKNEVFGLVYLEAMSVGCIVIGARNEGADGIIIDGVNGFLCEAGNATELKQIILKIKNMPSEDLCIISENAVRTSKDFADSKMAQKYLGALTF